MSKAIMTASEFAERLKAVAKEQKTVYMLGTFGAPLTESLLARGQRSHPEKYTEEKLSKLRACLGKGYFAFDCSGLVKAILWGWDGSTETAYGGAVYKGNEVPDFSSARALSLCDTVDEDFSTVAVGEILWQEGHVGVYVGDGYSVECTSPGVIYRKCLDEAGKVLHGWKKHGKLSFVAYDEPTVKRVTLTITLGGIEQEGIEALKRASLENLTISVSEPM